MLYAAACLREKPLLKLFSETPKRFGPNRRLWAPGLVNRQSNCALLLAQRSDHFHAA